MQSDINVNNLPAGVDEVGRGCLCSDVVVAAVILDPENPISELMDSKKLTANKRTLLSKQIKEKSLAYSIIFIDSKIIDKINILQATLLGMKQSIESLSVSPSIAYIDGNHRPSISIPAIKVIKGDQLINSISAASILAKVARDNKMLALHEKYPDYGFDRHKGYPTKSHIEKLQKHGLLPFYRSSYKPVKILLEQQN